MQALVELRASKYIGRKKKMIKAILTIFLSVVCYGFLRSHSVGMEIKSIYTGNACTLEQKVVDTIITRNCSIFLPTEEE